MHGLRIAPRDWQSHWAAVLISIGFIRLQADANVYVHLIYQVYILAYVDYLLVIGAKQRVESIIKQLLEKFLMKHTGDLNSEGGHGQLSWTTIGSIG